MQSVHACVGIELASNDDLRLGSESLKNITGRWTTVFVLAALLSIALWLVLVTRDAPPESVLAADEHLSPFQMLAAAVSFEEGEFASVQSPWSFEFPSDHGGHSEYRTEWWQLTGILRLEDDSRLGVQLLLLRLGVRGQPQEHPSAWATSQIYAGLFSISDPLNARLRVGQRVTRGAVGLAGATIEPIDIWVEGWRLKEIDLLDNAADLSVHVRTAEVDMELELRNAAGLIEPGVGGGLQQGAPFQFYIQPRMEATGTLLIGDRRLTTTGTFLFEHAWGELPLPGGPIANDRFTLQLDDRRVLLLVRTHRADGAGVSTTTGLLMRPNDAVVVLSNDDIALDAIDYWTSSRTGARYPVSWRIEIPEHGIHAQLVPYREDQEGAAWIPFWAGPVRVQSPSAAGEGFIQLYGYEYR
jgi:predicted secreted hydrolase